jgi:basic membrane protein A
LVAAIALGLLAGTAATQPQLRIGLVFDAGGKFDKSFNESAWDGSQRAARELGVEIFDAEPGDPSQAALAIRQYAQEGLDLIIGVGFANEPAITALAREFPQGRFAIIDSVSEAPNVASLVFKEHEGSFLVGYIAGTLTQTNVVGFVGGMDIPLIHKFYLGYETGVREACRERRANCRILETYTGVTPEAWNNPTRANEIARSQQAQGADIIFAAAGASGLGVIDWANRTRSFVWQGRRVTTFFIGVDANQNYLGDIDNNPATLNYGLTSMVKRVDVSVYDQVQAVVEGRFRGGIFEYGLANDGVGYAIDQYNRALVPPALEQLLEVWKQRIITGDYVVPDYTQLN